MGMMAVNPDVLEQVITEALTSSAGDLRQINAIQRGAQLIRERRYTIEGDESLLIHSTSGHNYRTTVIECRDITGELCAAFKRHRPCKHRAAFMLLVRYNGEIERAC